MRLADSVVQSLDAAVAGRGLRTVFQPIVSLPDEVVVGYEALSRWSGVDVADPTAVFARATATNSVQRLDQLCIESAIGAVADGSLGTGALLSINCEASTSHDGVEARQIRDRADNDLQVMFEFTERSLLAHPRALLEKVFMLRDRGFRIALDDVGAHPDSLALLDIIRPDVIKLDLHLVQTQPRYGQARTLAAVLAHRERTGAVILAEGIETGAHLEQALALGASLGQGYRFGRPGSLDQSPCRSWMLPAPEALPDVTARSPFDLVAAVMPARTARKATLLAFSRQIESHVLHGTGAPPLLFTALQHDRHYTDATRRRYTQLADQCSLVAVFGEHLPTELGPGLRGVPLQPEDSLRHEWTVVVLGAHHAAALIARERPDDSGRFESESERRFDFVMTYDRTLVAAAAVTLLNRMP